MEILISINRPLCIWEKYAPWLMYDIKSQGTSTKVKAYSLPSLQERKRRTSSPTIYFGSHNLLTVYQHLKGPTAHSCSLPEVSFPRHRVGLHTHRRHIQHKQGSENWQDAGKSPAIGKGKHLPFVDTTLPREGKLNLLKYVKTTIMMCG